MQSKSVQILFTQDEFSILEKQAIKEGLTVPLFIKGKVLVDNEFAKCYKILVDKVESLKDGTKFTIRSLFGTDWTMSKGIKLTLGKTYYNRVQDKTISNVEATGKDSSNVMWYIKKNKDDLRNSDVCKDNECKEKSCKEDEVMNFLYEKVFNPILNSKDASVKCKRGVNITIARMSKLTAKKMVEYFWSALLTDNALVFSKHLEDEGMIRFEDIKDKFKERFNDEWLLKS